MVTQSEKRGDFCVRTWLIFADLVIYHLGVYTCTQYECVLLLYCKL